MPVKEQIDDYIAAQDPPRREAMETIHRLVLQISPDCRLWFLDGRNSANKVVSNESIGYGAEELANANGGAREFYRLGLSANTAGISLYLIGQRNREYLRETYRGRIGKAKVTGYCVKFRRLSDVNLDVLGEMIADHMARGAASGSQPQA